MTARRQFRPEGETPGIDYLRTLLADPAASRGERLRAAITLAGVERFACTRSHEPGKKQREQELADEPSDWDSLLNPEAWHVDAAAPMQKRSRKPPAPPLDS